MLGIIRVLTLADASLRDEHGQLMAEHLGTVSQTRCIDNQPHGIYNQASEASAVPKLIALAREMESEGGYHALSVSCAADPGLSEIRASLSLPVIGAGESGAFAARMISDAIAVIGITEAVPAGMRASLGDTLHSARVAPGFRRTTDLLRAGAHEALLEQATTAQEDGATAILFACTGFSTIQLKRCFDEYLSIPTIDLVQAQAIAASLLPKGA